MHAVRLYFESCPASPRLGVRAVSDEPTREVTVADLRAGWATLSHACRYHPYEFALTSGELTAWISDVSYFISRTED